MDPGKLEKAPIHNLDAERSVGFTNYELSMRGTNQLMCAYLSQVKAKSADLIENCPSGSFVVYRKIIKPGGRIPEIMDACNRRQQALTQEGLQNKEIANVAMDRRRNNDLEVLKTMGGPFTSSDQVDIFVDSPDIEDVKKSE